jgi:hypothetical protein
MAAVSATYQMSLLLNRLSGATGLLTKLTSTLPILFISSPDAHRDLCRIFQDSRVGHCLVHHIQALSNTHEEACKRSGIDRRVK